MSVADSKPTADANFSFAAESRQGTGTLIRADDVALQNLGMDSVANPSARNLGAEALHAIRRRRFAAFLVGSIIGTTAAIAAWFGVSPQYTATAILRVAMGHANILEYSQNHDGSTSFEVYKRTQRQLVRSPTVLTSVLQRQEIARLPLVTRQVDPLSWLQSNVSVVFPDDAEIMNVSVRCEDQQTAETLADTIVAVYLHEVVDAERQEKVKRLAQLHNAEQETKQSLSSKRSLLKTTAEALGTGDSDALTLAQKNTLQEYSVLCGKLNEVKVDLMRARHARKGREGAAPRAADTVAIVTDADVESAAMSDATITSSKLQLERLQTHIDDGPKTMFGSTLKEYVARYQASIDRVHKRVADRKEAIKKELALRRQNAASNIEQSLAMSVGVLEAQHDELSRTVEERRKEAQNFGRSSVQVELMRAEIKALDDLRDRIQRELHEANIEIGSLKPRVESLFRATTPHNDDRSRRLTLSASFGGAGFLGGCALVVLWDLRRRRLNTTREIAESIRLPLLGTVPHVPRFDNHNRTSAVFEDAIDGIVARLVFSPLDQARQVILVTSPSAGEGKTTVAINLAISLAGMGRRTILVDFDLRRPSLHNMFDVELVPGLSGALSGQLETLDAVLSTPIENLFLLPAGSWGNRGLSGRNDERVKMILGELREAYVHVVIDAGPVLPIVDTRVVARHADGVVMSLLRDVSEIPKVNSACELLRSFDVRILGAVMIGAPGEVYYARTITDVPETVDVTEGAVQSPNGAVDEEAIE